MRASHRILMTLPLVLGAVASCVPRSAAQLTVFDPANFQQNLLSARWSRSTTRCASCRTRC